MEKDVDRDMEGFVEDFAEEYGLNSNDQGGRMRGLPPGQAHIKGLLAIWGAAILILSLFITLFFSGGGEVSRDELTAVNARIEEIEVKLSRIENTLQRIGSIETGRESLKKSLDTVERSLDSLKKQVAGLSAKVEANRKSPVTRTSKAKSAKGSSKNTGASSGRGLHHVVKKGETLFGIAEKYDLTLDDLLKMNNIKKDHVLKIGEKLLVVPIKQ